MKTLFAPLFFSLALFGFAGCASQSQLSSDVPAEGPGTTVANTYPVPPAWVPQK